MNHLRGVRRRAPPLLIVAVLAWLLASRGRADTLLVSPSPNAKVALEALSIPLVVLSEPPSSGAKQGGGPRQPWLVRPEVDGVARPIPLASGAGGRTASIPAGWFASRLAGRGPPPSNGV